MASSLSGFFGGVATVVVALGIGFGGGLYLTDTSLMNDPVGGKPPRSEQVKATKATDESGQKPATASAPQSSQVKAVEPTIGASHDAPLLAESASRPPAPVSAPTSAAARQQPPASTATAPALPRSEPPSTPAETVAADRARSSGPPFARAPDDAQASATPDDEEAAKAQRHKTIAAQRAAEQQRRTERRRLAAERAERRAAESEIKAAIAARDRARHRYDSGDDDGPRGFVGFASGRAPERPPTFFGIPLFGD